MELIMDATIAVEAVIADGHTLIDVDFPPLPNSVSCTRPSSNTRSHT